MNHVIFFQYDNHWLCHIFFQTVTDNTAVRNNTLRYTFEIFLSKMGITYVFSQQDFDLLI